MDVHFTHDLQHKVLHLRFGQTGVRNLMDDRWFDTLEGHLAEADQNPEVRVVLLSAEGDAFCSGANLKGIQPSVLTDDYAQSALARLPDDVWKTVGGSGARSGHRRWNHLAAAL